MKKIITKRKRKRVARRVTKRVVKLIVKRATTRSRRIKISRRQKNNLDFSRPILSPMFIGVVRELSVKLLVVTLIAGLNVVAISRVGYTMGYYNDVETSTENTLEAGSVDFLLNVSGWQATTTAVSMPPGDVVKKVVEVNPQTSNPFQYFATSTNFVGDSDFCTGLNVVAELEGVEMYNGSLVGLRTATTTTLDSWEFTYTTGVSDFQNRVCDFDIDYNAWQERHNYPTFEDGGFSDTEKVTNHLASWGFRINKVYYDVAPNRGEEFDNEWVEIYNQTNTALDISGWEICDNNSCDTLPTTTPIPALKYAVIVATSTTVSSLLPAYWYLPSEVTQININSRIGNGLANEGDRLILKRPDGVVIDQMNWQDDTDVWNPGAVDVAEGNVLARVPSGFDTDSPSDWQELVPPSVDLIYPNEAGSYTWYWGQSKNITWTATNNNGGPDGDLDISIFYVKDVNHSGTINAGDTTHMIVESTANDGAFTWTVPSGFLGYIWIHLLAIGPENPMLNSGTISGRIYDPFPIFLGPENIIAPELEMTNASSTATSTTPTTSAGEVEVVTPEEETATSTEPILEDTATSTEAVIEEEVMPEVEVPTEPVETVITEETPTVIEESPAVIEEAPAVAEPEPPVEPTVEVEPIAPPEEAPVTVEDAPIEPATAE